MGGSEDDPDENRVQDDGEQEHRPPAPARRFRIQFHHQQDFGKKTLFRLVPRATLANSPHEAGVNNHQGIYAALPSLFQEIRDSAPITTMRDITKILKIFLMRDQTFEHIPAHIDELLNVLYRSGGRNGTARAQCKILFDSHDRRKIFSG